MFTYSRVIFLSGALALSIVCACAAAFGLDDAPVAIDPAGRAPSLMRSTEPMTPIPHAPHRKLTISV